MSKHPLERGKSEKKMMGGKRRVKDMNGFERSMGSDTILENTQDSPAGTEKKQKERKM
jgi:hypothetical protein